MFPVQRIYPTECESLGLKLLCVFLSLITDHVSLTEIKQLLTPVVYPCVCV